MYETFFHLQEQPFQLKPDPRYFFASSGHKRALDYLKYGLNQGEGFIAITGDVGAGKTTLVQYLLSNLDPKKFVTATVVTSILGGDDMLRLLAANFGLPYEDIEKSSLLIRLQYHFRDCVHRGVRPVIILDESQNLSVAALEELRMLSNLDIGNSSLQMILVGQPEFREKMGSAELSQLRQRMIASYHLSPITASETRDYILHRLKQANWSGDPEIDEDAFTSAYKATGGVPRLINVLFNRVLLLTYLESTHRVCGAEVRQVAEELQSELSGLPMPKSKKRSASRNAKSN